MTAYLLTWNPRMYALGGDAAVHPGAEMRWSCHSKQPAIGDTVYLMRLGVEPRGLIARGTVTQASFEDTDWGDASAKRNYIMIRLDEYRPDCASGLLPMQLLTLARPQFKWNPQSSGVSIDDDTATLLDALWRGGAGHNSLQQFVSWVSDDPQESRPHWLLRYHEMVALADALRDGRTPFDDESTSRLWLRRDNGVSDVGTGGMSNEEFKRNREWLAERTRQILDQPDASTMEAVLAAWRERVTAGQISRMNRVVINRVFATAAPRLYSTILREKDCQSVLKALRDQFQLEAGDLRSNDWLTLNAAIRECMHTAGLEPARALENNIAMWALAEMLYAGSVPSENKMKKSQQATQAGPLNRILFGPPGTGKTYRVVEEAMRILSPELFEHGEPDRETVLKPAFDRFVGNGQIVFTTFHQSYSYEDFVEGIRATTGDDGQLHYSVAPGVFKELCSQARRGLTTDEDPFKQALARLEGLVQDTDDGLLDLRTSKGKRFRVRYDGKPTFLVYPESSIDLRSGYTASMTHVRTLYETGDTSAMYNVSYVRGMLTYLQEKCGLPKVPPQHSGNSPTKPFILIIDEINRGNVSRIFGELITLIEDSKRAGRSEALEIVLPYSKHEEPPFSVPDNVYLIGTMNTADRSLAGLDIALRRRFSFIEIPPKPDLLGNVTVEGVNIGDLLTKMNERIEALLDRDHCLGHAYFMPLKTEPTLPRLKQIFRDSILPLLQEYFFEDWQRIQWVLNDHRKPAGLSFLGTPENNMAALFGPDANVNAAAQRWVIDEAAFGRIEAYAGIIAA